MHATYNISIHLLLGLIYIYGVEAKSGVCLVACCCLEICEALSAMANVASTY